jgi:nucleoside-diphosphate-sugar epimerase
MLRFSGMSRGFGKLCLRAVGSKHQDSEVLRNSEELIAWGGVSDVNETAAVEELHVVFGTGPVGTAVMRELHSKGKRVRMINRSGKANAPDRVEITAGDAADRLFAREVAAGAAVVYDCLNPPYNKWPELFPRLQASVTDAAAAAGAKLVVMDNLYMYGPTEGKPLTEKTPYLATTRKGRTRAQMAETLMKAHDKGRVRVAVGRASDFFGPGAVTSAMGAQVFRPALRGKAAKVLGDPDLPHTYTFVPDIGRALVILGERDEALGEVWHLPSVEAVSTRELVTMVFAETGKKPKLRAASRRMLQFAGVFNPTAREVVEMLQQFEEPFIMDCSKFTAAFGDLATPLPRAVQATVDWFRVN